MLTVSPGVPEPLRVGVVSRVVSPGFRAVPGVAPSGFTMISGISGVAGAVVSIASSNGGEMVVLPASSVAWTVSECGPSVSGVVGVKLQPPLPSSTAVPSRVVPS